MDRYYSRFIYPFTKADVEKSKLVESAKWRYYEDVNNWINSEAYKIEHTNLVREFYQELAVKALTPEQTAGYRLALVFIKNYETRLNLLAEEFNTLKITEQRKKQLT